MFCCAHVMSWARAIWKVASTSPELSRRNAFSKQYRGLMFFDLNDSIVYVRCVRN